MKNSNIYKLNPSASYEKPKVETVVMEKALAERLIKQDAQKNMQILQLKAKPKMTALAFLNGAASFAFIFYIAYTLADKI